MGVSIVKFEGWLLLFLLLLLFRLGFGRPYIVGFQIDFIGELFVFDFFIGCPNIR